MATATQKLEQSRAAKNPELKAAYERKAKMERMLSGIAGFEVELTIRGEREFTLSAEGRRDMANLLKFFGSEVKAEPVDYDEEIDFTCLYFSC